MPIVHFDNYAFILISIFRRSDRVFNMSLARIEKSTLYVFFFFFFFPGISLSKVTLSLNLHICNAYFYSYFSSLLIF